MKVIFFPLLWLWGCFAPFPLTFDITSVNQETLFSSNDRCVCNVMGALIVSGQMTVTLARWRRGKVILEVKWMENQEHGGYMHLVLFNVLHN